MRPARAKDCGPHSEIPQADMLEFSGLTAHTSFGIHAVWNEFCAPK
jgi:hypothetical protein